MFKKTDYGEKKFQTGRNVIFYFSCDVQVTGVYPPQQHGTYLQAAATQEGMVVWKKIYVNSPKGVKADATPFGK